MPSTILWQGGAAAVAQVDTLTVGGTIEASDVFIMTIGKKTLSVIAGSTVAATVATTIAAAWNALDSTLYPEFAEITALATTGGALTLTANTPGIPFTVSVSTTESGGGAADDQTFTQAHTIVNSGPNDISTATNYSTGVLPASGDTLIFQNSNISALYGLSALLAVTLAKLQIDQSFTGTIGSPQANPGGYIEYRSLYFQVGATTGILGNGNGQGSGRIKIDFGSVQTNTTIVNCGQQIENGVPQILLLGTHASNVLTVMRGTVGLAYNAGEVSTVSLLNIGYVQNQTGDSNVLCGLGCTLTTIVQSGGYLSVLSNVTTFTQYAGAAVISGTATVATGVFYGSVIDQSSGTWTTITVGGVYDHRLGLLSKTITTLKLIAGAEYHDPYNAVTLTNGLQLLNTIPVQVTLDLSPGHTLAITA
jgi:trimeric autotransporter adhesin